MSSPSPKYTLDDAFRRIRRLLVTHKPLPGSDDAFINTFLNDLRSGADANSARLLVSLGIDINNYYQARCSKNQRKAFLHLIKKIILKTRDTSIYPITYPPELLTPAIRFDHALNTFTPEERKPLFEFDRGGQYVRVSNFNSYLKYIILKNLPLNPHLSRAIDKDSNEKLYYDFDMGRKYRTIRISKLESRKGWVFLACKEDVKELIETANVKDLLDYLGFYFQSISADDKFLTYEYPKEFDHPIFQPTSLTGDWGDASDKKIGFGNEFFMPYKIGEDWGRTYSVSGQDVRVRERIHSPLNNDDSHCFTFTVTPLGDLKETVEKANLMKILEEVLRRYEQSL